MPSRRSFLMTAAAAPAAFGASTRSYAEIEKLIARGDVKGKLTRDEVPTPALLLDLDLFESNVKKMFDHVKGRGRAIRPHGKTHKCPEVAKYLARNGASGNCAAKLSEAEVFALHGVTNLLVTTAVVGKHKIERAVRLAQKRPETIFVVDNAQNATDLNDAARAAKIKMNVAIDLLLGRTGIQIGPPAVALAEAIAGLSNLKFAGLQSYSGGASHTVGWENRARVSRQAMEPAVAVRREIEKKGIAVPLLTGGSTGTYNIDTEIDGIDELQPGSFMFMDVDYNLIGGKGGSDKYTDFGNALTVWTTVVSKPSDNVAIVDGGYKAFATDRKFGPEPKSLAGAAYAFNGDEHGKLTLRESAALKVGDRVEFINPHCDPTVNLYDHMFCLRGDNVEAIWKIAARGMSQ